MTRHLALPVDGTVSSLVGPLAAVAGCSHGRLARRGPAPLAVAWSWESLDTALGAGPRGMLRKVALQGSLQASGAEKAAPGWLVM